jgi:hypothetical protein
VIRKALVSGAIVLVVGFLIAAGFMANTALADPTGICIRQITATAPSTISPSYVSCDIVRTLLDTTGGSATFAIAASTAGPTIVKAVPGRLVQLIVTTAGTISETCFDNASAASGTILGVTPATTTVGQILKFDTIAVNGITCTGGVGSPALTVSTY